MIIPWLALIESNTTGTGRLFVRAARDLGLRPVLLTADASRYSYLMPEDVEAICVDTADEEAMLDVCRRLARAGGLAGVTSSSEYYIATAAALSARLGLHGPDPRAVRDCRDKGIQRERLRAAGVRVPDFRVVDSAAGAKAAAGEIGLPVVVKPVSGTGSSGVLLCRKPGEVEAHARALLENTLNERGMPVPPRVLIEQLACGPEFSVETFGTGVIGITRKHLCAPPHFVETGHDFPYLRGSAEAVSIRREVVRALKALNLSWGPGHTELRLTDQGPTIIEVNPRLAGGMIPELVRISCGIDLICETLRAAVGRPRGARPAYGRFASIRFVIPAQPGLLVAVEGLDVAEREPGIADIRMYSEAGSYVDRHGDFRDRVGHVIAFGETLEEAEARVERALGSIKLIVAEATRESAA